MLARALLQQLGTPEVTGLADALTAASAASEALARQHTVLGAALRTGRVTTDDRAAVNATDNAFTTGYRSYLLALGPDQALGQLHRLPRQRAGATPSRPPS